MDKIRNSKTCLHYCAGAILLLILCYGQTAQADALIDYVDTSLDDKKEIIEIVFNEPAQYLYHTPKTGSTMLLGFYTHSPRKQGNSWQRPISFKRAKLLQSIDIYYEKGFNPHLYFEFSTVVNIQVQPRKDLRGFILTISEHEKE